MLVRDAMSPRLITLSSTQTVYEAVGLMVANNISGLAAIENGVAAGVITLKDVVRRGVAKDKDLKKTPVSELMTRPVITINDKAPIEKAADAMKDRRIKRLVVVDDAYKVVGIITAMDIVSAVPKLVNVMFNTWNKPDWK